MAVSFKAISSWTENLSASSVNVVIPAHAEGDVAVMVVGAATGSMSAPSGWTQRGQTYTEGSLNWRVFDRVLPTTETGTTTVTVSNSANAVGGLVAVFEGASDGVSFAFNDDNTSDTYGDLPALAAPGMYFETTAIYAARSTYSSTPKIPRRSGNATATATERSFATMFGSFRIATGTIDVSTVTTSSVFAHRWSGGNADSNGLLIFIPVLDTTDPVVDVTAPSASASVSGTVTVTATITDNVAVTSASFTVGSGSAIPMSNSSGSTWTGTFDSLIVANGSTVIEVTGFDAAGNSGNDSVTVTIDNAPASTISYWDGATETVLGTKELRYWVFREPDGQGGGDEIGFWYQPEYGTGPERAVALSYWDGTTETPLVLPDTSTSAPYLNLAWVAYGDSSAVVQSGTVDYTANQVWVAQLSDALNATSLSNRHVNSSTFCDVFERMNWANSGAPWVPGSAGFVTTHGGGNELLHTPTVEGVRQMRNAILGICSLIQMESRILATQATSSVGTWSTLSAANHTSGGGAFSSASGNSLTFTVTGENATVILLNGMSAAGADFSVTVDGGTPITGTTDLANDETLVGCWFEPIPVLLTDMGPGQHTVVVSQTGGGTLIVDSVAVWYDDPADAPFHALPQAQAHSQLLVDAGATISAGMIDAFNEAFWDALRAWPVPSKKIVFHRLPWMYQRSDPDMVIWDGYHPNLKGHTAMKNSYLGSIVNSGVV